MKIVKNGSKYSAIVGIGEKLKKSKDETGQDYLFLNRGINAVVNIDLSEVIPNINFNSNEIQIYPPNSGLLELKKSINNSYFHNQTSEDNIFITNGGMNGLDLIIRTIDVEKVFVAEYYWGAYKNIININKIGQDTYKDLEDITKNIDAIRNNAIIICDPNNPLGTKIDDAKLINIIKFLQENNVFIIWDSPYRRLFLSESDTMYEQLLQFSNVIITDSFSKSIGLSGQRIGFVHSLLSNFNEQFNIHLLYNTNGINAFSQVLVNNLLSTEPGRKAAEDFRLETVKHIRKNIIYLNSKGILATEFYKDAKPIGIFVIVNKSYDQLLEKNIGSVPLNFFTLNKSHEIEKYARICVSVNHEIFKTYFDKFD